MIPQDKLDEWKRLADEATPGPWQTTDWSHDDGPDKTAVHGSRPEIVGPGQFNIWPDGIEHYLVAQTSDGENPLIDAAFIAHARTALPALLAENARLRRVMAESKLVVQRIEEWEAEVGGRNFGHRMGIGDLRHEIDAAEQGGVE